MSDGIKRMYEDMEEEQYKRDKMAFSKIPIQKRLRNVRQTLEYLHKLHEQDFPMTRAQRFYVTESIKLLEEIAV